MNWGTFRTQIRRSILKEVEVTNWSDESLMDACGWALDTFCAHTALVSGVTYEAPEQAIVLPDDVFDDIERTGLVYVATSPVIVARPTYIIPDHGASALSYVVWGNTLTFSKAPSADVTVRYFAYYPHPVDDNSEILIPRWAYNAVAHLVGALALTQDAINSSGISRWNTREESGTPEDNALRIQQNHLLKVYENEINRFPRQDRLNHYQKLIT